MSDLTIHWPDAAAEQIIAARGRLDVARPRLLERGVDDVLDVLAEVFDLWCDADSSWRLRLLDEHSAATGFSREVVERGLSLALESWSGAALRRAISNEYQALVTGPGRVLAPYSTTSVLLAGSIPMPSLLQMVLPLSLLSPTLVKSASRDPVTPRLLAESIASVDSEIGRAIEVVSFAHEDSESLERFLAAECVVASGSDETLAAIGARLRSGQRFVAYGHKLSVAIVDTASLQHESNAIASALSLDVALWDQLGCLSPVAVFVVGDRDGAASTDLAEKLAKALGQRASELPRGEIGPLEAAAITRERDAAGLRAAAGQRVVVHAGKGTGFTVIAEADGQWRACPLQRFVRIHPVADGRALADALGPVGRYLSSIALAIASEPGSELAAQIGQLGASRVCAPGRLQAPPIDWPHDGHPILMPLARLRTLEVQDD